MVGAQEYCPTPNGRLFMWGYYEGDPTDGAMWIGKLGEYTYLAMPSDNGLALVAACPSIDRRDEVRADREAVFEEGVRAWPELHAGVAGVRRAGPLSTMAHMHGFFRQSAGPGWALVGDAGHFKDPTPGQGIADALRQAEQLAQAIGRGLGTGEAERDRILRDWWRWRDDDAWEMYWFAHELGAPGVTPPLLSEVQRRIAADDNLLHATMRVFNHELRPSEVYTPAFSLKTIAQALRRRRGQRGAVVREAGRVVREEARRRRWRRAVMRRR
jgi:2-polyprenyl-6-methoxyphenol hydroxylase-like FAD-dependent oxidoreductase